MFKKYKNQNEIFQELRQLQRCVDYDLHFYTQLENLLDSLLPFRNSLYSDYAIAEALYNKTWVYRSLSSAEEEIIQKRRFTRKAKSDELDKKAYENHASFVQLSKRFMDNLRNVELPNNNLIVNESSYKLLMELKRNVKDIIDLLDKMQSNKIVSNDFDLDDTESNYLKVVEFAEAHGIQIADWVPL